MSEEETTPRERNLVALATLKNFEIREFTLAERRIFDTVSAKHGVEKASQVFAEHFTKTQLDSTNTRLEAAEKIVTKLEERLDALLDTDWDEDELNSLIEKLETARATRRDLTLENLPSVIETNADSTRKQKDLMELQERANLDVVREVAAARGVKLPSLEKLLDTATSADHDLAAEIVETGVRSDPLHRLNRRGRRSLAKKKRSAVLN